MPLESLAKRGLDFLGADGCRLHVEVAAELGAVREQWTRAYAAGVQVGHGARQEAYRTLRIVVIVAAFLVEEALTRRENALKLREKLISRNEQFRLKVLELVRDGELVPQRLGQLL